MVTWLRLVPLYVLVACTYETPTETGPVPESKPVVGFEFPTSGADEATGTVMIPVKLSKPSTEVVTVPYAVLSSGGTAVAGTDFVVSGSQLTFQPGEVELAVPIQIKSDTDETESDETFSIALADPVGANLDADKAIHQVKIADHLLPRINFEIADPTTFTEGNTQTTLVLVFTSPDGSTPVATEAEGSTVVIGVAGDVAANPTDVEDLGLADGTELPIPGGVMSVDLPLLETDDNLDEEDAENLVLQLKGASQNLVLGTTITHQHTIADNDDPPTIRYQVASSNVNEDGGTVKITVELSGESGRQVTAAIAQGLGTSVDSSDFTLDTQSVTFAPHTPGATGETTQAVSVTVIDDKTDENAEDLVLAFANVVNAGLGTPGTHKLTIKADNSDPPPTVSFVKTTDTVDEDPAGGITSTVTLSAISGKVVTVQFAIDPVGTTATLNSDFVILTGSPLVFMPGTKTADIVIDVPATAPTNEPDEFLVLDLVTPNNATLDAAADSYTLTITE